MYTRNQEWAVPHRHYKWTDGVEFQIGRKTLLMGILNATPDSFSDGGRYTTTEAAIRHAYQMMEDGADLIDIGGESTRPGSEAVSLEEELRRVVPIVRALHKELPGVPLSIDTYKAETARQCLEAGAHIINDIWGLKGDERMAAIAAEYDCPVILSHNRHDSTYTDVVADLLADLQGSVTHARHAGISEHNIWLDPGIGFAKSHEENLQLMGRLSHLAELGYPVLLGTSRKRFIRHTLNLPVDELIEGTAATVGIGIMQGCQLVRVHDVKEIKRFATMTDAIVYGRAEKQGNSL